MGNLIDLKHQPEIEPDEELEEDEDVEELFMEEEPPVQQIAWKADLRRTDESESRRYAVMAGIVFLGGAVAWWQSSFLLLLTVLLGVAAWELRERYAGEVPVSIDAAGVTIGSEHYPHANLVSFDVHDHKGRADLSIVTDSWHAPLLRISLGDQDPAEVHALLARYVPYEAHPVPLIERLMR